MIFTIVYDIVHPTARSRYPHWHFFRAVGCKPPAPAGAIKVQKEKREREEEEKKEETKKANKLKPSNIMTSVLSVQPPEIEIAELGGTFII